MPHASPGPNGHPPSRQLGELVAAPAPPPGSLPLGEERASDGRSTLPRHGPRRIGTELVRIRRGMLGLAVLVILLTIAIAAQSTLEDRERRLDEAGARAMGVARAVEQHVGRLLDSNGQFLYDLRTHVEAEGGIEAIAPERLQFLLQAPRLYDEATRRVFLADAQGHRTAIVAGASGIPLSVAHREYFLRHESSPARAIAVDAPFAANGANDRVMPLSVRIDHADGSFAGVAVLSFDVEYLMRYLRARELPPGGSVALVASDGRVFLRHPEISREAEAKGIGRTPAFPDAQGVTAMDSPFDGSPRIVAYHRVGAYPLYAVVAVSRDEVLRDWMRGSFVRAILAGAVIGMAALFAVMLATRVDAQRGAEERLAGFERALDHAGDIVYWVAQDGRVVYLNEAAARRFRAEPGRMPAQLGLHDVAARHSPSEWAGTWAALAEHGSSRFASKHRSIDGNVYPVEVSASRIEVGGTVYAFLIVREVQGA